VDSFSNAHKTLTFLKGFDQPMKKRRTAALCLLFFICVSNAPAALSLALLGSDQQFSRIFGRALGMPKRDDGDVLHCFSLAKR
jgi:hypothetical protein